MKVYTAEEHADQIAHVWFWGLDVTWWATEVGIWLGAAKCGLELGLGYVDLVRISEGFIVDASFHRYYGPIVIKFKESQQ